MTDILSEAIKLIGEVVSRVKDKRQETGIHAAADALTIIGAIVESVRGKDSKRAGEELDRLRRALADNDAAADKALEDKFDNGGD